MPETDLVELRNQLEILLESKSYEVMIPILKQLSSMKVTKENIQSSKIGNLLNKIRKLEEDRRVAKEATGILIEWKKILIDAASKFSSAKETEGKFAEKGLSSSTVMVPFAENPLFETYKTNDPVRDKCIEMLVTALTTDNPEMATNPDELVIGTAQAIEAALFTEFLTTSAAYKSKFRSKYLNLKDKANPHLRTSLLMGSISPARFSAMTTTEMASEERRKSDLDLQQKNLDNTKAVQDTQAETDQFKCGRCGKRKCKYYQLQTRSADEPMTTFVTCINCNNRWKFC